MPTRPFTIKRTSDFLGLSDDLALQAGDEQASELVNGYKDRRKLKRRGGQSALGAAALAPDIDLKALYWAKIDDTEHLLAVHDGDVVDFLAAAVGSIVPNGEDRLPGSGSADANMAWVEGHVIIGNGVDPNVRYNGETGSADMARDFEADDSEFFAKSTGTELELGDFDFTVTAHVRFESLGVDRPIVAEYHNASGASRAFRLWYDLATDRLAFGIRNDAGAGFEAQVEHTSAPVVGTDYFVAGRYNASTDQMSIWVNGTETIRAGTFAGGTNAVPLSVTPFHVGRWEQSPQFMDGAISKVGFWKTAAGGSGQGFLSTAELTSIYDGGVVKSHADLTAGEKTGLIEYWDAGAASGDETGAHAGLVLTDNNSVGQTTGGGFARAIAQQMVTAPATAPTVTLANSGVHSGEPGTLFEYRISFLNADGEYSEAGPTGSDTSPGPANSFDSFLTNIPQPTAGQDATGIRIWRRSGGNTQFRFVDDVSVGTTDYTDLVLDADLGEELIEGNTAFPPARYWDEWEGRAVAAFCTVEAEGDKQTVFISNKEQPFYSPVTPDDSDPNQGARKRLQGRAAGEITGLKTHGGLVAVFTGGSGYFLRGDQPRNFHLALFTQHGCTAHRTIVSARNLLIWLSNDGVYAFDGTNVQDISEDVRATLEAMTASEMAGAHAVHFQDRYYLFWATGALAFDLQYRAWSELSNHLWRVSTASSYVSGTRERLWAAHEGHARVYQLETGVTDAIPAAGTAIAFTWASKDHDMGLPGREKRVHLLETKFRAATGTATIRLYRGTGDLIATFSHNLADVEVPGALVSAKLHSVGEEARSEHFRIEVEVASAAERIELLAVGAMYTLAS